MRIPFLISAALLVAVGTVCSRDIATLSGQTYRDVAVIRTDSNGIEIIHRDGLVFLEFSNLPDALRGEFTQTKSAAAPKTPAPPESVQPRPELAHLREIITLDGSVYRDVTIVRIERTGLRVSHREGSGLIDFLALPVSLREKYGFNEESYTAGKAAEEQKERTLVQTQRRLAADSLQRAGVERREPAEAPAPVTSMVPQRPKATPAPRVQPSHATQADDSDYDDDPVDRAPRDNRIPPAPRTKYSSGTVRVGPYMRKSGFVEPYTRRK
jgi:hypothetical protein